MAYRSGATRTYERSGLAPYYERLEPLAGGYEFTRNTPEGNELTVGRLRVFDDRGITGVHAQFTAGRKTAVFHFDDEDGLAELHQALGAALEQL